QLPSREQLVVALGSLKNEVEIGELELGAGGVGLRTALGYLAPGPAEVEQVLRRAHCAKIVVFQRPGLRLARRAVMAWDEAGIEIVRHADAVLGRAQIVGEAVHLRQYRRLCLADLLFGRTRLGTRGQAPRMILQRETDRIAERQTLARRGHREGP